MIEASKPWTGLPIAGMELQALQLLSGQEIRVHGIAYGVSDDDVTVSTLLGGSPPIDYDIVSVPMPYLQKIPNGYPLIIGEDQIRNVGGLVENTVFPGLPIGPMHLYSVSLRDGGECRVRAQGYRIEDGFAFFSVECATSGQSISYDLASIPAAIIQQRSVDEPDIRIVD